MAGGSPTTCSRGCRQGHWNGAVLISAFGDLAHGLKFSRVVVDEYQSLHIFCSQARDAAISNYPTPSMVILHLNNCRLLEGLWDQPVITSCRSNR